MNKKTVSISVFVMLCFMLFFIPPVARADKDLSETSTALSENEMRWRIEKLMGPIDYRYTPQVRSEVKSYVLDYRKGAEELLGRMTIYFPVFEEKIRERALPVEIKYLSVIESSLKVNAYSRVGAAGLWQFMRGTAREYGLTVNRSFDQRYAVEESTDAALQYLSTLYDQFGDWTLALAAYNCGPGNVRKAMRRSGKSDYWSIRNYLPRETRNYIPKFVAVSYLMEYYYEHELMPERPDNYYFETLESRVYQHLSFNQIASLTDTPIEIIKNLNPSYRKNFIPANTIGMKLILPRKTMYDLLELKGEQNIKLIPKNKINFNAYIRENFEPDVARYLLVDQYENMQMHTIPSRDLYYFASNSQTEQQRGLQDKLIKMLMFRRQEKDLDDYLTYRLKTGETLLDVARKYPGVNIESIIRINNIKLDHSPPPGTLLKIMEK